MGNNPSYMLQDDEITLISEETGFSPAQVERLYSRFTVLDRGGNGSLSRQDCIAIPELAINPLCDRIVQMFFSECDEDHERINFRQFMSVLAIFRSSHKSSPISRSRNVSRQESLNNHQKSNILDKAPQLLDSIESNPFSSALSRLSRHSSFHDSSLESNHHHQNHHLSAHHNHHNTNQHSFHYAASSNHLPSLSNGHHHHHHHHTFHHSSSSGLDDSDGHASAKKIELDPDEPPNSAKSKLLFMFKLYDVNDDNVIDIEDLMSILKMMVGTYVDDVRVRRIAERTLHEADKDCNGSLDFEEFCASFAHKDVDELLKVKFNWL